MPSTFSFTLILVLLLALPHATTSIGCGPGTVLDEETNTCVVHKITCGKGTVYDARIDSCVPATDDNHNTNGDNGDDDIGYGAWFFYATLTFLECSVWIVSSIVASMKGFSVPEMSESDSTFAPLVLFELLGAVGLLIVSSGELFVRMVIGVIFGLGMYVCTRIFGLSFVPRVLVMVVAIWLFAAASDEATTKPQAEGKGKGDPPQSGDEAKKAR
eukprot:m.267547 g.267547  ORF g.267547 m.267547 type:complete len:215 (+) comp33571_c0_seq1:67-711(+)